METLRKIIEEKKAKGRRKKAVLWNTQTKRRYSFLYVGPSSLFCIACSCKRC